MKERIRLKARELGFDDCRITTAEAPASSQKLREWLGRGFHGEMGYLHRNAHKRVDPQQVLAGARSIVTLATSYSSDDGIEEARDAASGIAGQSNSVNGQNAPVGTVARYARFEDYHEIIGERLRDLTSIISELSPGARSLWYVDTGPLLERDLAQRAGLGFIGKHTNLISRTLGNWIFLSEIITTLELEPDAPEKNRCGSCVRCITACPTQAIRAPYELDARRCISYLTIELKGSMPEALRPLIGDRIYGCDDCLAVCPWNRFAREGKLMKSHARPDLQKPNLLELLDLDEQGFRRRFAGTPILRTKRRGLLRNVCVALGNVGDSSHLPALQKATRDPEPLIQEHACWAIDQIRRRGATSNRAQ